MGGRGQGREKATAVDTARLRPLEAGPTTAGLSNGYLVLRFSHLALYLSLSIAP